MSKSFILGAIAFLAFATPSQSAESVRLAIVVESAETMPAADLLTVELSKSAGVTLLERAQVQKVYQEQSLASGGRDLLKLGQILGADGLLILDINKQAEPQHLSARLVAVKPGAALRQRDYPWPLADPSTWSALVVSQFQPLFPKLAVLARDAIPISILNLRSAVASPEAQTLERELTLLLYNRLMNEKDIFVLERRRLELLATENELNAQSENAFWNGSYLLEGTINQAGLSRDGVTISGRLLPPGRQNAAAIEVSGTRTNLPEFINTLAARIMAAATKSSSGIEWKPQAEAGQYFNEAKWMLKWRMHAEAAAASEAAWALGRKTAETAELRIRAYRESAADPGTCLMEEEKKQISFGRPTNPRIRDSRKMALFSAAYEPERLGEVLRAEELYAEAFKLFVASNPKLEPAWLELGVGLLDRASSWLRYYYFTVPARAGEEAKISRAKALAREIAGLLENHPGFAPADATHTLVKTKGKYSAFWVDTPEEGVALYRKMVEAGQWPWVRRRFLNAVSVEPESSSRTVFVAAGEQADLADPCLTGWRWEARRRCPDVWKQFLDELARSSDPLKAVEGKYLQCSYAWSKQEHDESLARLLEYILEQREAVAAGGLIDGLKSDLLFMIQRRANTGTAQEAARLKGTLWSEFDRKLTEHNEQHARAVWLAEQKNYLRSQNTFDLRSFGNLLNANFSAEEAKQLLPLLEDYQARLRQAKNLDQSQSFFIGRLEEKLKNAGSPAPPPSNTPASAAAPPAAPAFVPGSRPPASPLTAGPRLESRRSLGEVDPASLTLSNLLKATRFWKIPLNSATPAPGIRHEPGLDNLTGRYRDGRLWIEVRRLTGNMRPEADFFGINLDSFDAEQIHYAGENFNLAPFAAQSDHLFEVHHGFLYLALSDAMRRYSLKDRKWETFPLPVSGPARPARLGDRLFFTTDNSILELAPDGSFHVLASSRRQPALNLLDTLDDFRSPRLFLSAAGALNVCVQNRIYSELPGTNGWRLTSTLPQTSSVFGFDDGILAASAPPYGQAELWGMYGPAESAELLFQQPATAMPGSRFGAAGIGTAPGPTPRWPLPAGLWMGGYRAVPTGDSLWALVGTPEFEPDSSGQLRLKETRGRHTLLMRFRRNEREPAVVPVRLVLADAGAIGQNTGLRVRFRREWLYLPTPKGLAIGHELVGGVWFIPLADLEANLEKLPPQPGTQPGPNR